MPHINANGISLFYDEHGNPEHEPIVLVMGLGAQMTMWPAEFVDALVAKKYRVIRFDNRDIGLSEKMEGARAPKLPWQVIRKRLGWPAKVPYSLSDMADDAAALIQALGLGQAHVVGASMGGMIAQLMAVNHSDKLLSLTSIMSTTGNAKLPQADKAAMEVLIAPLNAMDEDTLVERGIDIAHHIGSPGYRPDPERLRERVLQGVRRSVYPAGLPRQLAAIIDDGDRSERLSQITTPTLVLHGEADPLVKLEAGKATAAHVPGAKLVTIPGWGHDLPAALVNRLADEIVLHAKAARATAPVAA